MSGDRIAIYSPDSLEKAESTAGKTNAEAPLAEDFTVRGIFYVGFPDFNSSIIVASLDDARDLLAMPDNTVQGLEVKLHDPFQANAAARQIRDGLAGQRTTSCRPGRTIPVHSFSTRWRPKKK